MKKSILALGLCLVLCAVLVAGCLGGDDGNDSNTTNNTTPSAPPEPINPPADTAMYRGNVTDITTADNTTTMTLAQVKGTNFGAAEMNFVFGDNSKMNFNLSDLKTGQYIEVYYGVSIDGTTNYSETQTVIVANLLQNANMVVYNGEIVSVTPAVSEETSKYSGKLEVKLENNTTMIFNCGEDTQFYMNMSNVKEGTPVNIYGNWIIQTSMPPQTTAWEVREFYTAEK